MAGNTKGIMKQSIQPQSKTPRTDQQSLVVVIDCGNLVTLRATDPANAPYASAAFARQLERDIAVLQEWHLEAVHKADQLEAELDATRSLLLPEPPPTIWERIDNFIKKLATKTTKTK